MQSTLFDTRRGAYGPATGPATGPAHAKHTRNAAYREITDRLSEKQRRYFSALRAVTQHGHRTRSGQIIHDPTDQEAAALLGWGVNEITGRRDELMARNHRAATPVPVVEKSQRRTCNVTGNRATAWRAVS